MGFGMDATIEHLVRRFYNEVWNAKDFAVADKILHPELSFRSSIGDKFVGIDGFLTYVEKIHGALGGFQCTIDYLLSDEGNAAARMTFSGAHRGRFLGFEPSGRQVTWPGAAFFTLRDDKIDTIWVLGDVDTLKRQLMPQA